MLTEKIRKKIQSLHLKKNRSDLKLFIAEGIKTNIDLLKNGALPELFVHTGNLPEGIPINLAIEVSEKDFQKLSLQSTPAGIIGVYHQKNYSKTLPDFAGGLRLYIDGLQDPGNLGTIIRTAHWFGASSILLSKDSVEWYNPKTVQSTMGSLLSVPFLYCEKEDLIELKNEGLILTADMQGDSIHKSTFGKNDILCIGNESRGISNELKKLCDKSIHIPASNPGNSPESLNAAVTATLFLFKFSAQL